MAFDPWSVWSVMMRGNPWYGRAAGAYGRTVRTGEDLAAVGKVVVLLALESGPRPVAALPRAWPVTRVWLRAAVEVLVANGLVSRSGAAPTRLILTRRGRQAVRRLRECEAAA